MVFLSKDFHYITCLHSRKARAHYQQQTFIMLLVSLRGVLCFDWVTAEAKVLAVTRVVDFICWRGAEPGGKEITKTSIDIFIKYNILFST